MTARVAQPLPECSTCQRPVKRETHDANGGLCSTCTADAVAMVLFTTPAYLAGTADQ